MNYKAKSKLSGFNKFLSILLVIAIIFLIVAIALNLGDKGAPADANNTAAEDVVTIDEFKAGTYGGVQFNTMEDVVNYYVEAYDYTKTLTEPYTYNGEPTTCYKLMGNEGLEVKNLLVEGNSNSMLDNLVPGIVGGLFQGGVKGLPPSGGLNPDIDTVTDDKIDVSKSLLTPDDVLAANVVDNGDGTITLTIQPKEKILSMPAQDSQGHFFNTLGDISSVVESISVLSFSSGTINDNFVVAYKGGSGVITIDTATKEITKADYTMLVHIDVQHANVAVLKDKNASLDIVYTNQFPATTEYLNEKGFVKA